MKELLQKVLSFIFGLLSSSPTKTSEQPSNLSEMITKRLSESASSLLDLLEGKSKEEKEYLTKVAFFKSLNTQELTLDEIVEFGEHLNEAIKLGIVIQEQHKSFWKIFINAVKDVSGSIPGRVAATALRTMIGI